MKKIPVTAFLFLAMMLSSAQGHQTLSPQTFPLLPSASVCSTAFMQSVPLSYVKGHGIETCVEHW